MIIGIVDAFYLHNLSYSLTLYKSIGFFNAINITKNYIMDIFSKKQILYLMYTGGTLSPLGLTTKMKMKL